MLELVTSEDAPPESQAALLMDTENFFRIHGESALWKGKVERYRTLLGANDNKVSQRWAYAQAREHLGILKCWAELISGRSVTIWRSYGTLPYLQLDESGAPGVRVLLDQNLFDVVERLHETRGVRDGAAEGALVHVEVAPVIEDAAEDELIKDFQVLRDSPGVETFIFAGEDWKVRSEVHGFLWGVKPRWKNDEVKIPAGAKLRSPDRFRFAFAIDGRHDKQVKNDSTTRGLNGAGTHAHNAALLVPTYGRYWRRLNQLIVEYKRDAREGPGARSTEPQMPGLGASQTER